MAPQGPNSGPGWGWGEEECFNKDKDREKKQMRKESFGGEKEPVARKRLTRLPSRDLHSLCISRVEKIQEIIGNKHTA